MAERYDSILVRVEIGNSRKLRRLSPEQRWCVLAGVWALAAKAPTGLRGNLLVTPTEPVTEQDVAEQAGVKLSVARSTLARMRELGMLEQHQEGEYVHDWHEHQREPGAKKPSDAPEATRERKQRQRDRERESHADVTRDRVSAVTPLDHAQSRPPIKEKRREEKRIDPPNPPTGGRSRDLEKWRAEMDEWVQAHPVTDRLRAEWKGLVTAIHERFGDSVMIGIDYLHPHRLGEQPVLGARALGAIDHRHRPVLQTMLGVEPCLIQCQCELARGRAA